MNNTVINSSVVSIKVFRPFDQRSGESFYCGRMNTTPIARLSFARCPSNVARFVMSVIVDAIQSVAEVRSRPNVGQELFERIESKFNASANVKFWIPSILGRASTLCLCVRSVGRRISHAMRRMVSDRPFTTEAPTRAGRPRHQTIGGDDSPLITYATT